jgi:5-formyltetrahydrofolate cyclo-ligase
MSDALSKKSIRREAMLHRDRIDPASENAEHAVENFIDSIKPEFNQSVALYWPKGREYDSLPLLHALLQAGHVCALPVAQGDSRVLKFVAFRDGDAMAPGAYGIMQPVIDENSKMIDPDIIVVPFLAFDRHGNRIGYGGGYYDATLRHYRAIKPVIAVGLGYGQQAVLFNLPVEEHDEKLDWIITPIRAQRYG